MSTLTKADLTALENRLVLKLGSIVVAAVAAVQLLTKLFGAA